MTQHSAIDNSTRELDARSNDGIDVRLLWHPASDRITVEVATGLETFELDVAASQALDAFHHPFAYAAYRGVVILTGNRLLLSDAAATTSTKEVDP